MKALAGHKWEPPVGTADEAPLVGTLLAATTEGSAENVWVFSPRMSGRRHDAAVLESGRQYAEEPGTTQSGLRSSRRVCGPHPGEVAAQVSEIDPAGQV